MTNARSVIIVGVIVKTGSPLRKLIETIAERNRTIKIIKHRTNQFTFRVSLAIPCLPLLINYQ